MAKDITSHNFITGNDTMKTEIYLYSATGMNNVGNSYNKFFVENLKNYIFDCKTCHHCW